MLDQLATSVRQHSEAYRWHRSSSTSRKALAAVAGLDLPQPIGEDVLGKPAPTSSRMEHMDGAGAGCSDKATYSLIPGLHRVERQQTFVEVLACDLGA
jgi:hypothetical protein